MLLIWQNGVCAECGCHLPDDWHADHYIPYSVCHETNLFNMQALCPACNLRKSNRMPVRRDDVFDLHNARNGQRGAFDCIVQRIAKFEPYTTIVLPTRYGKSDVIRLAATHLVETDLAATCIVLEPNITLRDQVISRPDFDKMFDRYPCQVSPNVFALKEFSPKILWNNKNKIHLYASTIQLMVQNIDVFEQWVRYESLRTKKPVVFFIDESHTGSEDNSWGSAIERLSKCGASNVLLTATPYRSDGKKIPGFKFEEFDIEDKRFARTSRQEDGSLKVDIWSGTQKTVRLIADYEVTFKQAWEEDVICGINKIQIGSQFRLNEGGGLLQDMQEGEVRRVLRRVVESEEFVDEACHMLVERLRMRRGFSNQCTGIVFCGNDQDDEDNKHAKMIKRMLLKHDKSMRVVIVTNKQENESDDAQRKIEDFKDGRYDVLIVKQMGSVGLDVPHLKVGLDLSSVRTAAMYLQRLMRPATKFTYSTSDGRTLEIKVCDFITPADCISERLFVELVRNEGGSMRISTLDDLENSYEVAEADVGAEKKNDLFMVEHVAHYNTLDTLSNNTTAQEYEDPLNLLLQTFPELAAAYTDAGIKERLSGLNISRKEEANKPTMVNISEAVDEKRAELNSRIDRFSKLVVAAQGIPNGPDYTRHYVEVKKRAYVKLKQLARTGNVKTNEISDVLKLETMIAFVNEWIDEQFPTAA